MSKPKSQKAQRDEAYLANIEGIETVPGQLDINGTTYGANGADLPPKIEGIPDVCPVCSRLQTYAAGWTIAAWPGIIEPTITCGNCASSFVVPEWAVKEYQAAMRAYFAAKNPVKQKREPRARGAG